VSLADDIREYVEVAHEVTEELQPIVQHLPWVAQTDGFGRKQLAAPFGQPIARPALIEERYSVITVNESTQIETHVKLYFIKPIASLGAAGRAEPVDPRDKFVLPSGRTGPVVHTDGFVDAGTGAPYINIVYLGKLSER
jgi:hypothetical protein